MIRRRLSVSTSFMLAALRVLYVDASGASAGGGRDRGRTIVVRSRAWVRTPRAGTRSGVDGGSVRRGRSAAWRRRRRVGLGGGVRLGPTLQRASGGLPLPEGGCVRHRCPTRNDRTRSVDVRAMIQQRIDRSHVVAARGPVQWGLGVVSRTGGVRVRPGGDERADRGRRVREVPRPVGRGVRQGPAGSITRQAAGARSG